MKKKVYPLIAVLGLILIIIAIMFLSQLIQKYTPTKTRQDLSEHYNVTADDQVAIILNNELVEPQAKIIDGNIYLDYNFVHDMINQRFYWDSNEKCTGRQHQLSCHKIFQRLWKTNREGIFRFCIH